MNRINTVYLKKKSVFKESFYTSSLPSDLHKLLLYDGCRILVAAMNFAV